MIGSHFLPDRQRALVEWLGLGVLALGAVELRQVVEAGRYVGALGFQGFLQDRQRADSNFYLRWCDNRDRTPDPLGGLWFFNQDINLSFGLAEPQAEDRERSCSGQTERCVLRGFNASRKIPRLGR